MAALSSIAAISAIAASAFSVVKTATQKPGAAPALPNLPDAPTPTSGEAEASVGRLRQATVPGSKSGRAATLLTGPSGLSTDAPTQRKTLLGL